MTEVSIIGLDPAKNVFQVHCSDRTGSALLRKKLRRDQLLGFFDLNRKRGPSVAVAGTRLRSCPNEQPLLGDS